MAASQRHLGPLAKLPCFLHLWTYGVTKLSLGEHGTARPRSGLFHSHRKFMSFIRRLREEVWDVLRSLNLTYHENFCMLATLSVKGLSLQAPRRERKCFSIILDSKREAGSPPTPAPRKGSAQTLCIALHPFHPILLGPVPGTRSREAQNGSMKSFNSWRERSPREDWEAKGQLVSLRITSRKCRDLAKNTTLLTDVTHWPIIRGRRREEGFLYPRAKISPKPNHLIKSSCWLLGWVPQFHS